MGYKWLAHDLNDKYDVAFVKKPYKYKYTKTKNEIWTNDDDWDCIEAINIHIAKWSDDETLSIDWLLRNE